MHAQLCAASARAGGPPTPLFALFARRYDQVSATQAALLAALTDGSGKPRVTVHA